MAPPPLAVHVPRLGPQGVRSARGGVRGVVSGHFSSMVLPFGVEIGGTQGLTVWSGVLFGRTSVSLLTFSFKD